MKNILHLIIEKLPIHDAEKAELHHAVEAPDSVVNTENKEPENGNA